MGPRFRWPSAAAEPEPLAAAVEPRRRPSKREHVVADVLALLEEHPELRSADLVARVQDVRKRLMSAGLDPTASSGSDVT